MRCVCRVMAVVAICAGVARADQSLEGVGLPPGGTFGAGRVGGVSDAVANLSPTAGAQFGFIDSRGFTSTSGSILLSLGAGDTLTMDLNFLTSDGGVNVLALTAGVVLTPLPAGDFDGTTTGPLDGVPYEPGGTTDWIMSSYVVPVGGSHQLRFLVADLFDRGIESGLALPGVSALVGLGLLALLWRLRRRTATAGR